jgi:hypothetical protein
MRNVRDYSAYTGASSGALAEDVLLDPIPNGLMPLTSGTLSVEMEDGSTLTVALVAGNVGIPLPLSIRKVLGASTDNIVAGLY